MASVNQTRSSTPYQSSSQHNRGASYSTGAYTPTTTQTNPKTLQAVKPIEEDSSSPSNLTGNPTDQSRVVAVLSPSQFSLTNLNMENLFKKDPNFEPDQYKQSVHVPNKRFADIPGEKRTKGQDTRLLKDLQATETVSIHQPTSSPERSKSNDLKDARQELESLKGDVNMLKLKVSQFEQSSQREGLANAATGSRSQLKKSPTAPYLHAAANPQNVPLRDASNVNTRSPSPYQPHYTPYVPKSLAMTSPQGTQKPLSVTPQRTPQSQAPLTYQPQYRPVNSNVSPINNHQRQYSYTRPQTPQPQTQYYNQAAPQHRVEPVKQQAYVSINHQRSQSNPPMSSGPSGQSYPRTQPAAQNNLNVYQPRYQPSTQTPGKIVSRTLTPTPSDRKVETQNPFGNTANFGGNASLASGKLPSGKLISSPHTEGDYPTKYPTYWKKDSLYQPKSTSYTPLKINEVAQYTSPKSPGSTATKTTPSAKTVGSYEKPYTSTAHPNYTKPYETTTSSTQKQKPHASTAYPNYTKPYESTTNSTQKQPEISVPPNDQYYPGMFNNTKNEPHFASTQQEANHIPNRTFNFPATLTIFYLFLSNL